MSVPCGFIFAAVAAAGLTALLVQLAWLDIALRIGGGAYLFWIGIKIWRGANEPLEISNDETAQAGSFRRALVRALLVQLANPKTAIFHASIANDDIPSIKPIAICRFFSDS